MCDLLQSVDEAVKERSIRRLLNEMGRRKWRQLRRPELSEIHARKRLAWAHEYHPLHLNIGLKSVGLMSVQLKEEQELNLDGLSSALVSN